MGLFRKAALTILVAALALAVACDNSESANEMPDSLAPTPTPTVTPRFSSTSTSVTGTPTTLPSTATPTVEPTFTPAPEISPLAAMLATARSNRDMDAYARLLLSFVPDIEESRKGFWVADYAHAAGLLGVERPNPEDNSAVDSYVLDVWQPSLIEQGGYLAGFAWDNETRRNRQRSRPFIGFAQADISVGIKIGSDERALEIVFGEIDPVLTHQLIAGCDECPEPEVLSHAAREFFAWGSDFEKSLANRYAPPLFDSAGTRGRFAVDANVAWRAGSTAGMELLLGAAAGETASQAESADHVGLLELMMSRDAVSVFLSSETIGKDDPDDAFLKAALSYGLGGYLDTGVFTPEQVETLRGRYLDLPYPPAFNSYAVATVRDGATFKTLVAYPYANEIDALLASVLVHLNFMRSVTSIGEQSYSDAFGPIQVNVVDRFVVVELEQNVAIEIVKDREPIFLHE